mmetsp:Transcript_51933/g.137729  ORF Transcript_51933/g.137729 Transcript_51933/m.137729 type:complete len:468 (-) Transcript_51933:1778-3181(-)
MGPNDRGDGSKRWGLAIVVVIALLVVVLLVLLLIVLLLVVGAPLVLGHATSLVVVQLQVLPALAAALMLEVSLELLVVVRSNTLELVRQDLHRCEWPAGRVDFLAGPLAIPSNEVGRVGPVELLERCTPMLRPGLADEPLQSLHARRMLLGVVGVLLRRRLGRLLRPTLFARLALCRLARGPSLTDLAVLVHRLIHRTPAPRAGRASGALRLLLLLLGHVGHHRARLGGQLLRRRVHEHLHEDGRFLKRHAICNGELADVHRRRILKPHSHLGPQRGVEPSCLHDLRLDPDAQILERLVVSAPPLCPCRLSFPPSLECHRLGSRLGAGGICLNLRMQAVVIAHLEHICIRRILQLLLRERDGRNRSVARNDHDRLAARHGGGRDDGLALGEGIVGLEVHRSSGGRLAGATRRPVVRKEPRERGAQPLGFLLRDHLCRSEARHPGKLLSLRSVPTLARRPACGGCTAS